MALNQPSGIKTDIEAINSITIVPSLLDVVCRTTGMGFAAIARVTDERWITCQAKDDIGFGLKPGDELVLETTICNEIRQHHTPVIIDHVEKDENFSTHHTPLQYGFQSYISVPIFRKDGRFFGTLCAIDPKPARLSNPEIRGMFELYADLISFHLQALQDMEDVTLKLKEEQKIAALRETFIAILGHDLQNPVSSIQMASDLLLQADIKGDVRKFGEVIYSASSRMQGLINNLLDFAKGHLGEGIQLNFTDNTQTLMEALTAVMNEIKTTAPEKEFETNIQLDHPIKIDVNRVAQLFSNLLGNAVRHGSEKSIKVEVISNLKAFKLSVANSGKKIPAASLQNLFKPFFREGLNKNDQGLGLGLYISSEIAKAHGGSLEVSSTDQETRFTFNIPLSESY